MLRMTRETPGTMISNVPIETHCIGFLPAKMENAKEPPIEVTGGELFQADLSLGR
jgi:hypothetical protein